MRKNSESKKAVLDFLFLVGVIRLDWISNMDNKCLNSFQCWIKTLKVKSRKSNLTFRALEIEKIAAANIKNFVGVVAEMCQGFLCSNPTRLFLSRLFYVIVERLWGDNSAVMQCEYLKTWVIITNFNCFRHCMSKTEIDFIWSTFKWSLQVGFELGTPGLRPTVWLILSPTGPFCCKLKITGAFYYNAILLF